MGCTVDALDVPRKMEDSSRAPAKVEIPITLVLHIITRFKHAGRLRLPINPLQLNLACTMICELCIRPSGRKQTATLWYVRLPSSSSEALANAALRDRGTCTGRSRADSLRQGSFKCDGSLCMQPPPSVKSKRQKLVVSPRLPCPDKARAKQIIQGYKKRSKPGATDLQV